MKSRSGSPTAAIFLLLITTILSAQQPPNLVLTVTGIPTGFSSSATTTCGAMTFPEVVNVVSTEPLFVRLESTPTQVIPTPLVLRRVALVVGLKDCSGAVTIGQSIIPINLSSATYPINSFVEPFDPLFGPPLLGPSIIELALPTNYLVPVASFPLHLVLQAVTEDLPGGSAQLIVSNPVEVVVIDPAMGFPPTITNVTAPAGQCLAGTPNPSGPEGGQTVITLTGIRFPVQTNWFHYAPAVKIGTQFATDVVIHSQTMLTAVTPAANPPTCPPVTDAGPHDVTFKNHPDISPLGVAAVSQIKFTYCSGRTPAIGSLNLPHASPEGGEALTISGSDFLHGADIVLTSQSSGTLTTTLSPDNSAIQQAPGASCSSPTSTTIMLTTPPFCVGAASIQVINPDGVMSGVATLDYAPLDPTVSSVQPTVTVAGLSGATTFSAMNETGTTLSIGGMHFITPTSPLFGAPTVPQDPSSLFPSRTEIAAPGTMLFSSSSGVTSASTISVIADIGDQTGAFRENLGIQSLRVVNPPCVSATPSDSFPILIQDSEPPSISGFFPNVVAQSSPLAPSKIRINGSNFFSTRTPTALPITKSFSGTPTLDQIDVPAVSFGGTFSPTVQMVGQNELIADLPPGLSVLSAVPITVFNPDGRSATSAAALQIVPRLTNPSVALNPSAEHLNAAALLQIAYLPTNPFLNSLAIVFVPNLTPNDDRLEDIADGGDPAITSNASAYDGVFLFNTRDDVFNTMRFFDFSSINVPATITLPAPVVILGNQAIQAGIKRVIFKAGSFSLQPNLVPTLFVDQNYPLVLRSRGDFTFAGILDVSGDALVNQSIATSPTLKFQYRCEWEMPSAGGGLGGRGGLHYENLLIDLNVPPQPQLLVLPALAASLPQPSLGTSATTLGADSGLQPRERTTLIPEPLTWGRYGLGRAPFGGQGGGGGGGGGATPGSAGQVGATTSPGTAGVAFGNFTNLPAGTPGRPTAGDAFVYGSTPADFDGPLGSTTTFPFGLFAGGSGGGGGGGSLALVVPCVSDGGRGGNGGGSAVLLSDSVFKLGTYGRIHADGEKGQLGIDAFPFANGEPLFVLCAPGSGGGGAGGLIFIAAVADVDLSAPTVNAGQHILSADGGPGGAPTGSTTVNTAHGGNGGVGRIRVAMNALSSMVPQRQAEFQSLVSTQNLNISPSPGSVINSPTGDFFRYPSP